MLPFLKWKCQNEMFWLLNFFLLFSFVTMQFVEKISYTELIEIPKRDFPNDPSILQCSAILKIWLIPVIKAVTERWKKNILPQLWIFSTWKSGREVSIDFTEFPLSYCRGPDTWVDKRYSKLRVEISLYTVLLFIITFYFMGIKQLTSVLSWSDVWQLCSALAFFENGFHLNYAVWNNYHGTFILCFPPTFLWLLVFNTKQKLSICQSLDQLVKWKLLHSVNGITDNIMSCDLLKLKHIHSFIHWYLLKLGLLLLEGS